MTAGRVTAIGFLTDRDLEVLGQGFKRHFPVTDDAVFADLLAQLDAVTVAPAGKGIVLQADGQGARKR